MTEDRRAMDTTRGKRVRIRTDHLSQEELNQMSLEGRRIVRVQRRKRGSRKRYVLSGLLVFLLFTSTISTVIGFLVYHTYDARYHSDLSLAQTGIQHLQRAEVLLTTLSKR